MAGTIRARVLDATCCSVGRALGVVDRLCPFGIGFRPAHSDVAPPRQSHFALENEASRQPFPGGVGIQLDALATGQFWTAGHCSPVKTARQPAGRLYASSVCIGFKKRPLESPCCRRLLSAKSSPHAPAVQIALVSRPAPPLGRYFFRCRAHFFRFCQAG